MQPRLRIYKGNSEKGKDCHEDAREYALYIRRGLLSMHFLDKGHNG